MKHKYSVCGCGHFRRQYSGTTGVRRGLTQECLHKRFKKPETFDLVAELSRSKLIKMR